MSLEVVEHVASVPDFLAAVGRLVTPGGLLVIGTLNRTPISFVKAIVGAEYVLGWLPRGTHDWRKFVKPAELEALLAQQGFRVEERCGVELNPLSMQWRIARGTGATYLQFHRAAT
jgi:2-polyprenyl-6-hydroxyphenyl methylase/3-demethylubiquinone-9 3-methyltransferase